MTDHPVFPTAAAAERLLCGFLGQPHREVLITLFNVLSQAADHGQLPTPVTAVFVSAVELLGTDPAAATAGSAP